MAENLNLDETRVLDDRDNRSPWQQAAVGTGGFGAVGAETRSAAMAGGVYPPAPYLGPRPSPALRIAPVLLVGLALVTATRAATAMFEFREVWLLHLLHADPTDAARQAVTENLHHLHTATVWSTWTFWPTLAVAGLWAVRRRSRSMARTRGEAYVGTRFYELSAALCLTYWVLLAIRVVLDLVVAGSTPHTYDDFLRDRWLLGIASTCATLVAVVSIVMVRRATADQRRREAVPPPLPPPAGPRCVDCGAPVAPDESRCQACIAETTW